MAQAVTTMATDSYFRLVQAFPLRRIASAAAHARAKAVYLRLNRGSLDRGQRDYLDVLADLIADYEERTADESLGSVSAAELVRHRLEQRGMSVNALARMVGVSQSNLSDMLSGSRDWSKSAIRSISAYLSIRAERFLA